MSKVVDATIRLLWILVAYLGVCAVENTALKGRYEPLTILMSGDRMLVFDTATGASLLMPLPDLHAGNKDYAPGSQ